MATSTSLRLLRRVLLAGLLATGAWTAAGDALSGRDEIARAQQPAPEERPEGAAECFERASDQLFLDDDEALRLCRGASSPAPAACFEDSEQALLLDDDEAVQLCRCAESVAPVRCYERLDDETFLDTAEIIQLCSPERARGLSQWCTPVQSPGYP